MVPQQHWDIQITRADKVPLKHWHIQNTRTNMVSLELWDIQRTAPTKGTCFPAHRHESRTATPPERTQSIHKKGYLTLGHPDYKTSRAGTLFSQLYMRLWDDQTFVGLTLTESTANYNISVILGEPNTVSIWSSQMECRSVTMEPYQTLGKHDNVRTNDWQQRL